MGDKYLHNLSRITRNKRKLRELRNKKEILINKKIIIYKMERKNMKKKKNMI